MSSPEHWIIGADANMGREFIVHRVMPRFVAQLITEKTDRILPSNPGAGQSVGFQHGEGNEAEIRIIEWIDPRPQARKEIDALLEAAMESFIQHNEVMTSFLPSIQ